MKRLDFNTLNTGHKTFDKQTDCLSVGNVFSQTQVSGFIRGFNNVDCNGFDWKQGELQASDLKYKKDYPKQVIDFIKKEAIDKDVIIYKYRHFNGKTEIIHGYIITDTQCNLLKKYYNIDTNKSRGVIDTVVEYIAN